MNLKNDCLGSYQHKETRRIVEAWEISLEIPRFTWVEKAFVLHKLSWEKSDWRYFMFLMVHHLDGRTTFGSLGSYLLFDQEEFQVMGRYPFRLEYERIG